jgi:hypothetical protein
LTASNAKFVIPMFTDTSDAHDRRHAEVPQHRVELSTGHRTEPVVARQHDVFRRDTDRFGDAHRVAPGRQAHGRLAHAEEEPRCGSRRAVVAVSAVQWNTGMPAVRRRPRAAPVDQSDRRGSIREGRQHRRRTDDAVLHLLEYERVCAARRGR